MRGDLRARGGQPRGPGFRWPQCSRRRRISRRRSQSSAGARNRRRGSSEHARCCCRSSGAVTRFRPCRTLANPGFTDQPQPFCGSLGRRKSRCASCPIWTSGSALVRRPRSWWCRSRRPELSVHGSWRRHDRQPPIGFAIVNPRSTRGTWRRWLDRCVCLPLLGSPGPPLFRLDGQLRVRDREVPAVLQQRDLQGHGELAESR